MSDFFASPYKIFHDIYCENAMFFTIFSFFTIFEKTQTRYFGERVLLTRQSRKAASKWVGGVTVGDWVGTASVLFGRGGGGRGDEEEEKCCLGKKVLY